MFRRLTSFTLGAVIASVGLFSTIASAAAQKDGKQPSAEQIAETVVLVYGGRPRLISIQRNGIERGRITRVTDEGRTEEISYERRFVRGETADKDKIRLDQKMPTMEYSLVYNGGRIFGIVNGTIFTPRQEAVADFLVHTQHNIDALLRYKENGSTLTYVNKEKQKNIDMWVIDLVDKEKRRTRYYISAQRGRVLSLEYDEAAAAAGGKPVKYKRTFHDYTYAQGTLVPYRTVLYEDGKQAEQTSVLSVSFGLKMDETVFQNAESTSTAEVP